MSLCIICYARSHTLHTAILQVEKALNDADKLLLALYHKHSSRVL